MGTHWNCLAEAILMSTNNIWQCFFFGELKKTEPPCEIMALFILHKLILQTCIRSHPVGLDVWFLVGPFVYFRTSCVWTAKALTRLRGRAGLPEHSLVAYVVSTLISCAGSYYVFMENRRKLSFNYHQVITLSVLLHWKVAVYAFGSFLCISFISFGD